MCVVQFTDHRCRHMCTMHIWSAIADSTCTTGAGRELLTRHSWLRCRQCDPTLSKPQFTSSHIKVKFKIIPTLGTRVLQKPTITQPFMKFSVYCRTQRLSMTCLVSGVPRGGFGVFKPPPPRNSEDICGVLDRISKKNQRLDFHLQFTVFSYGCNLLNKGFF